MRSLFSFLTIFASLLVATGLATAADHGHTHSSHELNLEIIATFDRSTPPGNIAVGPDGRIFMTLHPFYGEATRVVELLDDGTTRPYPNATWASAPLDGSSVGLYGGIGINVDTKGVLWILDGHGEGHAGRLVGWDTKAERLAQVIYLAKPVIRETSFLNDLAIDREHDHIYISDTAGGEAAIIVVDLETGLARRVLEGSEFTRPEDIDMVIDGRTISREGAAVRIGINPITVSPDNEWVYFGAMSGTSLYRISTDALRDHKLSDSELAARVERYGDKPISDGITVDGAGNVYITSITDDSIGYVAVDGSYHTLAQRDDFSWPDGFAFGLGNKVYATINELHRSAALNGGEEATQGEFKVIRFDALAKGKQGR